MSLQSLQYADPFIYNLGATDIPGNAGTELSIRALIVALVGGVVPPVPIVAVKIVPLATIRMYGGYRPKDGGTPAGFRAAAEGGGYETIPTAGAVYDLSDPLDYVRLKADGAGATGATISLYTSGQSSK